MKFCPECGTNIEGMKFCPECGYKAGASSSPQPEPQQAPTETVIMQFSTYLYGMEGKKKNVLGNIDISIPQFNYTLTTERLLIEKRGVVTAKKEEIELFKVKDIEVHQSLPDKMQKIGDVSITSSDPSTPTLALKKIKDPYEVKEAIRQAVQNRKIAVGMNYHQGV